MKSNRSPVNRLSLFLIGLSLILAEGCVSTPSSDAPALRLAMASSGTVLFEGKAYDPGALPGALKSHGVAAATPLLVAIPADAPMGTVRDLSRRLASAGYRRFVFTRPRHADAVPAPARLAH